MVNWKPEADRLRAEGFNNTQIADRLIAQHGIKLSNNAMRKRIARHFWRQDDPIKVEVKAVQIPEHIESECWDDRPVGVFSDIHAPFTHPNYLNFLIDTFAKYNVGKIVCCGDLVDHHAISRHQTETCAKSAYDELDAAQATVDKYVQAFPRVCFCKGNHDNIPARQAATVGIGERYLKEFSELFNLPDTWIIKNAFIIDGVLYKHGMNCTGKDGAINTAILERMSTVIGHSHSFGGVKYSANHRDIIFGLNVGCGIDIEAYAFAYGKHAKYRPTLGCGIVFDKANAIFVPMGDKYFRHNEERR